MVMANGTEIATCAACTGPIIAADGDFVETLGGDACFHVGCCDAGPTLGLFRVVDCGICDERKAIEVGESGDWLGHCKACVARYPASLRKATADVFDYELRLRTGEVIRFTEATIRGEWATLTLRDSDCSLHPATARLTHGYPRGLDVRIVDVVWCADAPYDA